MKFYIAFSIHGTNQFTVAEKHAESLQDLQQGPQAINGLTEMGSRRFSYSSAKDGQKLHWDQLLRKKDKKPLQSKRTVTERFRLLEANGWKIVARRKPHQGN